jgi:hypothetical protein
MVTRPDQRSYDDPSRPSFAVPHAAISLGGTVPMSSLTMTMPTDAVRGRDAPGAPCRVVR